MNDRPLMLRLENMRAFFSMRWDHGRAQTVQDAINDLKDYHEELAAAYAELRKIRPAIKAVFDRDVWDRAESAGKTESEVAA